MTENNTTVPLRLVAEYIVFGDSHGRAFMDAVLGGRVAVKGDITKYEVTGSYVTWFGMQLVTFTVDLSEHHSAKIAEIVLAADREASTRAKEYGEGLLNEIIGDSDVSVRAISWNDPDEPTDGN